MNDKLSAISTNASGAEGIICKIAEIPTPVKRLLRMQFKEFIHHIEDAEDGFGVTDQVIRTTSLDRRVA